MIALHDVSLWFTQGQQRIHVLRDANLKIPTDQRIGLLSENGQGKTVLLDALTGLRRPDRGRISTNVRWLSVLGRFPLLEAGLTLSETVKYLCLITEEPRQHVEILSEVLEIGALHPYQHRVVRHLSPGIAQRFKFALSLSLGKGFYLLDGKGSFGDDKYKKRSNDLVEALLNEGSFIFATSIPYQVKSYCDAVLFLRQGRLVYYDDVDAGVAAFEA